MKKEVQIPVEKDRSSKIFLLVLVGGIFAIVGGLALAGHLMNRKNKEGEMDTSLSGANDVIGSERAFKCISTTYPLQFGTCHPDVRIIQRHLKKLGATLGDTGENRDGIDGQFGIKTQTAARKYLDKETFSVQEVQNISKV